MPIRYSSVVGGSSSSGFNLNIGSSGNTTFVFSEAQPAGGYSVTSQLSDSTIEFYAIAEDGTLAGYTNTKALTATQDFDTMVVYGATNNDLITFEFRPTTLPTANGDQDSGAAPFLTSATPTTLASVDDTTTVTGGNFANNVEIVFTGQDDVDRAAKSIVRSSSTSLIVTRPDTLPVEQEPYSMTATNDGIPNPSANVNKLADYFDAGGGIAWETTSSLPAATKDFAYSTELEATDADGTSVAYSLTAGSLPVGLSLNNSTGVISGTPTVIESQSFTVTATDAGENTSDREFTLAVVEPSAEYLVIAGGGGGGATNGGGGGAGGYRSSVSGESSGGGASAENEFVFDIGTSYSVTVGAGGVGGTLPNWTNPTPGTSSAFGSITTIGGGRGGDGEDKVGGGGGSGGGGTGFGSANQQAGGPGTAGQGYAGGTGYGVPNGVLQGGGGGGGAGGLGGNAPYSGGGAGGAGLASSITGQTLFRAGGGAGAGWTNVAAGGSGVGGDSGYPGSDGALNTGSGGGAGIGSGNGLGGAGASGVVILRYPSAFNLIVGAGLSSHTLIDGNSNRKVTVFTAGSDNVSFEIASEEATPIEYLVVAGGGAGGGGYGGGGGAGGYLSSVSGEYSGGGYLAGLPLSMPMGISYTVTIGAGGSGGTGTYPSGSRGSNGTSSAFGNIVSVGGGGGGTHNTDNAGSNGGSGGGGSLSPTEGATLGRGTFAQGFNSGLATSYSASAEFSPGGGGASAAGGAGSTNVGGYGGDGITSSINGTPIPRGGGGGGFGYVTAGSGGLGGGGNSGTKSTSVGTAGTINTGGGGGALAGNMGGTSPAGGSGVVILKYADSHSIAVGPGLVHETDSSSVAGYKITTFTSGSDTITFS